MSYFFKAGTSAEHQLFQKSYILEKSIFQKSNISHNLPLLESYLFRGITFSKDAIFYPFRKATFLQHTFSEELLFHSYASFPELHLLCISKKLSGFSTSYVQFKCVRFFLVYLLLLKVAI